MISIIIPFYNHWDLTHNRLKELYDHVLPDDVEIILVDDASTERDVDGGIAWWQKHVAHHIIRYVKNEKNLGFGGSMNKGAKYAEGDVLVFLSNDVIISGNFLTEIRTKLEQDRESLIGAEVVYYPGGWNEFTYLDKPFIIPYANGWLLACTKEVWEKLGGFDLRYGRYDYEDVDLSAAAHYLGYNVVALNSRFVRHIGGATAKMDEDRMEHTKRNREVFIEKWQNKFSDLFLRLMDA